jgi:hypothetical protein
LQLAKPAYWRIRNFSTDLGYRMQRSGEPPPFLLDGAFQGTQRIQTRWQLRVVLHGPVPNNCSLFVPIYIGDVPCQRQFLGHSHHWIGTDQSAGLCRVNAKGMVMSRFKPSTQRPSIAERFPVAPHRRRMLSDRTYLELGRQTRLGDVPERRPPYIEAVITALAFAFLVYLVLGGA